jgi:hypothetical protein
MTKSPQPPNSAECGLSTAEVKQLYCKAIRQRQTNLLNYKSRYSLFWRIRGLLIVCFLLRK